MKSRIREPKSKLKELPEICDEVDAPLTP